MSLKCGIVGLPNVGKSTLFNALTKAGIAAENIPSPGRFAELLFKLAGRPRRYWLKRRLLGAEPRAALLIANAGECTREDREDLASLVALAATRGRGFRLVLHMSCLSEAGPVLDTLFGSAGRDWEVLVTCLDQQRDILGELTEPVAVKSTASPEGGSESLGILLGTSSDEELDKARGSIYDPGGFGLYDLPLLLTIGSRATHPLALAVKEVDEAQVLLGSPEWVPPGCRPFNDAWPEWAEQGILPDLAKADARFLERLQQLCHRSRAAIRIRLPRRRGVGLQVFAGRAGFRHDATRAIFGVFAGDPRRLVGYVSKLIGAGEWHALRLLLETLHDAGAADGTSLRILEQAEDDRWQRRTLVLNTAVGLLRERLGCACLGGSAATPPTRLYELWREVFERIARLSATNDIERRGRLSLALLLLQASQAAEQLPANRRFASAAARLPNLADLSGPEAIRAHLLARVANPLGTPPQTPAGPAIPWLIDEFTVFVEALIRRSPDAARHRLGTELASRWNMLPKDIKQALTRVARDPTLFCAADLTAALSLTELEKAFDRFAARPATLLGTLVTLASGQRDLSRPASRDLNACANLGLAVESLRRAAYQPTGDEVREPASASAAWRGIDSPVFLKPLLDLLDAWHQGSDQLRARVELAAARAERRTTHGAPVSELEGLAFTALEKSLELDEVLLLHEM